MSAHAEQAWVQWLSDLLEDGGPDPYGSHRDVELHDAFFDGYRAGLQQRSVGLQVTRGLAEISRVALFWAVIFGLVYFGYLVAGNRP